jgi:hypothetical protein
VCRAHAATRPPLQVKLVGRQRLVLDLSCRQRDGRYYVVTDRWQRFSSLEVSAATLEQLAGSCDEFLVHGARLGVAAARLPPQSCCLSDGCRQPLAAATPSTHPAPPCAPIAAPCVPIPVPPSLTAPSPIPPPRLQAWTWRACSWA